MWYSLHCEAGASKITCKRHQQSACKKAPHAVYLRYIQITSKNKKFTCIYAVNTSRRIHANCLLPHVNLLENSQYVINPLQNCLRLQAKTHAICRQKYAQSQAKLTSTTGNTPITMQVSQHPAGEVNLNFCDFLLAMVKNFSRKLRKHLHEFGM